jgi:hypothetical protein
MSSFEFSSKDDPPPQDEDLNIKSVTINEDGKCGNGWVCEHRWKQIYQMVEFYNLVQGMISRNSAENCSLKSFLTISYIKIKFEIVTNCISISRYFSFA